VSKPARELRLIQRAFLGYALKGEALKCDVTRLATKLQGEFVDTLTELDYVVFLVKQSLQITMEPTFPLAGPDLRAVRDNEYFVEIRRVQLDDARAAADMATEKNLAPRAGFELATLRLTVAALKPVTECDDSLSC
jgi:hypothetical protein